MSSPQQIDDLFEKCAAELRSLGEENRELRKQLALRDREERVTKLASDLAHQGVFEEDGAREYVQALADKGMDLDMAETFFNHTAPGLALDMSKLAGDADHSSPGDTPEDRLLNSIFSNQ